jgi:hypothetical protein
VWPVAGVLLAIACIFVVDGPRLWMKRMYREFIVFAILLAVGAGLGITKALDYRVVNPLDGISYLFKPAGEWMMRMLE